MDTSQIILCAAENAALPGGKVGGVGDVMRSLPPALAALDWAPTVLMPAYGVLASLPGAAAAGKLSVRFADSTEEVELFSVPTDDERASVIVCEHDRFCPQGPGLIYCDDGDDRPFATDATKFAFFSAVAASYVRSLETKPDVVHLHDWHAALYTVLRDADPDYADLKNVRTVYTIHNLAMQGIRPLAGDASSFAEWFPWLDYQRLRISDPRYSNCVNPMAAAIRLADRVSTVSPTYATEIQRPNDEAHGFHGGEGLEDDLQQVWADGRLFGILNGCDYPAPDRRRPGWRRLLDTIDAELSVWQEKDATRTGLVHIAAERLATLSKRRPQHLLTSIGRLTTQKVALFMQASDKGRSALDDILEDVGQRAVFIMLGTGDRALESRFADTCRTHANFLFLPGYSETFSDLLYKAGDLFLMPSSFEPCGISQMLAMRAGQPCVVHAVGGLKDTVRDNVDGFAFEGDTPARQAEMLRQTVNDALTIRETDETRWLRIREGARAARFTWEASAMQHIGELYE